MHAYYTRTREEQLAKQRAIRRSTPELIRARERETKRLFRQSHPEIAKQRKHDDYVRHRESRLAQIRAYKRAHPELVTQWSRRRRAKNPEKVRAARRRWVEKQGERWRHYLRERARIDGLRRRGITITYEAIDRRRIIARDGMICHICGKPVARKDLSFDHLIPISLGGPHTEANLRVAHRRCNSRRGNRGPAQLLLDL